MRQLFPYGAACGLLVLLAGCAPDSESERAYFAAREAERLDREEMRRTIITPLPDQEVVGLVQEHESPDGAGTTVTWINRRVKELKGQILFPRWQVTRRGSSKYEVRYTFTWIDTTNHISTKGFYWSVDGGLKLVSEAHEIEAVDMAPRARSFSDQRQRRVRDEEYSLE